MTPLERWSRLPGALLVGIKEGRTGIVGLYSLLLCSFAGFATHASEVTERFTFSVWCVESVLLSILSCLLIAYYTGNDRSSGAIALYRMLPAQRSPVRLLVGYWATLLCISVFSNVLFGLGLLLLRVWFHLSFSAFLQDLALGIPIMLFANVVGSSLALASALIGTTTQAGGAVLGTIFALGLLGMCIAGLLHLLPLHPAEGLLLASSALVFAATLLHAAYRFFEQGEESSFFTQRTAMLAHLSLLTPLLLVAHHTHTTNEHEAVRGLALFGFLSALVNVQAARSSYSEGMRAYVQWSTETERVALAEGDPRREQLLHVVFTVVGLLPMSYFTLRNVGERGVLQVSAELSLAVLLFALLLGTSVVLSRIPGQSRSFQGFVAAFAGLFLWSALLLIARNTLFISSDSLLLSPFAACWTAGTSLTETLLRIVFIVATMLGCTVWFQHWFARLPPPLASSE